MNTVRDWGGSGWSVWQSGLDGLWHWRAAHGGAVEQGRTSSQSEAAGSASRALDALRGPTCLSASKAHRSQREDGAL